MEVSNTTVQNVMKNTSIVTINGKEFGKWKSHIIYVPNCNRDGSICYQFNKELQRTSLGSETCVCRLCKIEHLVVS